MPAPLLLSWSGVMDARRTRLSELPEERTDANVLAYPDFAAAAQVLDLRRLGKQRVEALQIVRALTRPGYGWQHHPAVAMWRGYPEAVARYGLEICRAWSARGGADTCAATIAADLADAGIPEARSQAELGRTGELPPWLGEPDVHRSHQAALVRKDPAHYRQWFPDVSPDLPYVWPRSDRAEPGSRRG